MRYSSSNWSKVVTLHDLHFLNFCINSIFRQLHWNLVYFAYLLNQFVPVKDLNKSFCSFSNQHSHSYHSVCHITSKNLQQASKIHKKRIKSYRNRKQHQVISNVKNLAASHVETHRNSSSSKHSRRYSLKYLLYVMSNSKDRVGSR